MKTEDPGGEVRLNERLGDRLEIAFYASGISPMYHDIPGEVRTMIRILKGCRDMLRESAKQHRNLGEIAHARMCDIHADEATELLNRIA